MSAKVKLSTIKKIRLNFTIDELQAKLVKKIFRWFNYKSFVYVEGNIKSRENFSATHYKRKAENKIEGKQEAIISLKRLYKDFIYNEVVSF